MTTTYDALLAAVLADPKDDAPRLVLADWLDEAGQPERAEFIRSQVRRHRCPCPRGRWCQECEQAFRREIDLMRGRVGKWLFGTDVITNLDPDVVYAWPLSAGSPTKLVMIRGFAHRILEIGGHEWMDAGDALAARNPISRVKLWRWPFIETVTDPRQRTVTLRLRGRGRATELKLAGGGAAAWPFNKRKKYAKRLIQSMWGKIIFDWPRDPVEHIYEARA